jgi:predicted nucleotidyltransferase
MVTRRQIRACAQQIGRLFRPHRIILFGSFAFGKPTEDSDVDLLVIMPHKRRGVNKAIEISLKAPAPFPCDMLARSPQKIRQRLLIGDFFMREILARGKILYEARHH